MRSAARTTPNVTRHVVATIIAACLTSMGCPPSSAWSWTRLQEARDPVKPVAELGRVVLPGEGRRRRRREEPLNLDDRPRVACTALERRRDPLDHIAVLSEAAKHRRGRAPDGRRAARRAVELDVSSQGLGEPAALAGRLEPGDALGDRAAHLVGPALVAQPL